MKRKGLHLVIAGLMLFVTIGFLFTPHLPFSDNPIVKKGIEYTVHGMFGLLFLSLVLFIVGLYRLMLLGMACVGVLCVFLMSASNEHLVLPSNESSPKVRIAHLNLSYIDGGYDYFLDIVDSLDVDIVSLQELTPDWDGQISGKLMRTYPHVVRNVRIDPYGMGIYSKTVLLRKDTFNTAYVPNMHASIKLGPKVINVLSSYVLPPINNLASERAQVQLDFLSKKIKGFRDPAVLLGDFNMVYWSNEIRGFRESTRLNNSRRGFTPLGFKIPYDHIFYTDQMECSNFEEILDSNSNHIGIIGSFQFKDENVKGPARNFLEAIKE